MPSHDDASPPRFTPAKIPTQIAAMIQVSHGFVRDSAGNGVAGAESFATAPGAAIGSEADVESSDVLGGMVAHPRSNFDQRPAR